ncbi:unnamed protein product [Cercopithifilaria johnstoni]|uniref:Uncharacterized protein n=1 Tax=Cercopithifilaria johnstoni TaxID=2874296 RepID=A0A8J2MHT0_9BILA|nr:unnamed protein product [Cercopithifilaria johnstoni]
MANKPQLTFARIVSGTIDTNGTGSGSVTITQVPVTTAIASTTSTATSTITTTVVAAATTATATITTTATAAAATVTDTTTISETASGESTDVSIIAMESGNHISGTTLADLYSVTMPSVPNSLGKNKDGLHQRFVEERKPDSDGNAHVQHPIQFGQHQQNQYYQQVQRRNKPRPKTDRLRKDDSVLSADKEESETHTDQQPEVVLGPAPLPTVNAWFKQSTAEVKESKEGGGLNSQISSVKEEANSQEISLSLKTTEDDKDNVIKLVAQETLTFTSGNNSKKMAKPSHSGQTKQGEQLDAETTNVDDKAWPSLNEAVNEELKPDSVINSARGSIMISSHEVVKIADSSEAVCYRDMKQDRDKENESNGSGGKSNKSGKTWKKLDIDVDYTGREGQGRRGNNGPNSKSDHPQKNRRGPSFAKQQTVKEHSNPSHGIITDPASTTESASKIAQALAPASLLGCAQPLSCIAPALIYSPECATVSEEYAEEDYW